MLLTPDVEEGGGMIHRPDGHHALQLPSIVEIFPNRKKIQKPKLQSTASVSWRLSPCALDDPSDEYAHTLFDRYSIVVPDLDANDGRDSNDGASDDRGSRDGASNFVSGNCKSDEGALRSANVCRSICRPNRRPNECTPNRDSHRKPDERAHHRTAIRPPLHSAVPPRLT